MTLSDIAHIIVLKYLSKLTVSVIIIGVWAYCSLVVYSFYLEKRYPRRGLTGHPRRPSNEVIVFVTQMDSYYAPPAAKFGPYQATFRPYPPRYTPYPSEYETYPPQPNPLPSTPLHPPPSTTTSLPQETQQRPPPGSETL